MYRIHRIVVLLACAAIFFPGFNPGRITSAISRNVSLFTAGISYQSLVSQLARALLRGWVQKSTFLQLMISSDILIIGIILAAVGACTSFGNRRMRMDSPFITAGIKVTNLLLLNLYWLLGCLPIITIGASTIAAFTVTLQMTEDREDPGVTKQFWKAYAANLKHGILLTLIMSCWMALTHLR